MSGIKIVEMSEVKDSNIEYDFIINTNDEYPTKILIRGYKANMAIVFKPYSYDSESPRAYVALDNKKG